MFKPWPKLGRVNKETITITEKIDGTNAAIIVENGKLVGTQSRSRLLSDTEDNHGFHKWAMKNADVFAQLGDGHHFGEWAGKGINKNRMGLDGKKFFLFAWYAETKIEHPEIEYVEVLFQGPRSEDNIITTFNRLYAFGYMGEDGVWVENKRTYTPEGIVIYYHNSKHMEKMTIDFPDGKWVK